MIRAALNVMPHHPALRRRFRRWVVLAIGCVLVFQGLLSYLFLLSVDRPDYLRTEIARTESRLLQQKEDWQLALLDLMDFSGRPSVPASGPVLAFNLFIEKLGVELPACPAREIIVRADFHYLLPSYPDPLRDIAHPPQAA